jgi:2-amino-4-hydroxy-6-hydroxymethyldihydropteridine diphosphokinase
MTASYLLGIGSNIDPDRNIPLIIAALLLEFPVVNLSRVVRIPPVGMNSKQCFLNVVVSVETALTASALKKKCNAIEEALGRDREDGARKTKDRTADIDILLPFCRETVASLIPSEITAEYFLYPLMAELFAFLGHKSAPEILQAGVSLHASGSTFGETATTIYRDADTCYERIVE